MSDQVEVPFDKPSEQATLLLGAADELGLDPSAVQTSEGGFRVPQEVHDKAFGKKKTSAKKKTESEEG
jgi:hypothetical protein